MSAITLHIFGHFFFISKQKDTYIFAFMPSFQLFLPKIRAPEMKGPVSWCTRHSLVVYWASPSWARIVHGHELLHVVLSDVDWFLIARFFCVDRNKLEHLIESQYKNIDIIEISLSCIIIRSLC